MNPISKNGCTTGCTQPSQLSPTTMILHTQSEAILLITRLSVEARSPVAPNVAGSNPVSHPKPLQFKFRGHGAKMILTLRKNQVRHEAEISNNGRKATCRKEVWFERSAHSNNMVSAGFPSFWE
jgi:hypothetical protein